MANQDFRHLRLAGGINAIQEVVFTVLIDGQDPLRDPLAVSKLRPLLQNDFPKFEPLRVESAMLGPDGFHHEKPRVAGFSFERYKSDGQLDQRLWGRNGGTEPSWLVVNLLHYEGWAETFPKALSWLRAVAGIYDDLYVRGLALQYIDLIYWDSAEPLPTQSIFNSTSEFIPSRLQGDVSGWRSSISYARQVDDGTQIDSLDVVHQARLEDGWQRVHVATPLEVSFRKPIDIQSALADNGSVYKHFERLHDESKEMLRDVLTSEMLKRMGMA